jgi:hypothetical protein
MKRLLAGLFLVAACLTACAPSRRAEQRIVELPADNPNATLSAASRIGQDLIGQGFFSEVRQQFPGMSEQQFEGLFLSWNAGPINGKQRVFFSTGVRYRGPMPQAKAVAEYCELLVKAAVTNAFPSIESP